MLRGFTRLAPTRIFNYFGYRMKTLLICLFFLSFLGGTYLSKYSISQANNVILPKISPLYKEEATEDYVWLNTALFEDKFHKNTHYYLRASFDKKDKLKLIQIHIKLQLKNWYLINEASIESESLNLVKIERSFNHDDQVNEKIIINISKQTLQNMTKKETKIELNGKNKDYSFFINKNISSLFLNSIQERTS